MNDGKAELNKSQTTRLDFLKTTSVAGAGLLTAPFITSPAWRKTSPNDMVNHAIIGTGHRGTDFHCSSFSQAKGCQVVAVCDVDPQRIDEAVKKLPNGEQVKKYSDFRKLLEDKSINSVSIVTPDQWHTPIALWVLMAGKHV